MAFRQLCSQQQASASADYAPSASPFHGAQRELGSALISFGKMFDEANRILNGNSVSIKLQVKAHSPGSFEILFELSQNLVDQVSNFLTGDFVTSALNLKELILAGASGGGGLFWLIGKLKGKRIDKITDLKNGYVRIQSDNQTFEVKLPVFELYRDVPTRTAIRETLVPLEKDGIDSLSVKDSNNKDKSPIFTVEKESLSYFDVPTIDDEPINETEHDAAYSIVSLAFKENNKWRLYDGNTTINVAIEDKEFLEQVDQNTVSFSKGDVLICRVRTSQWRTNTGLKTEYTVLKIKEHKSGARQLHLPFDNED